MVQSSASNTAPNTTFSTQHTRLILELLPFKEQDQFQEWLASEHVRGSWLEFQQDFLSANADILEPDKAKTAQAAKEAIGSRTPNYLLYHPDKTGWSEQDHHVRFIVQVVTDNMLKGSVWSENDFRKRGLEITKAVYEVLSYLRASQIKAEQPPPGYKA
ncbi:hypothetical protein PG999_009617 [Apiospora kogelbergensis]|uniref:Uncharacterized protein n=1 Tax=Apiospora kogelbergensis TaxID=1337665 RepID=A0AAW0QNY1_9PEZI